MHVLDIIGMLFLGGLAPPRPCKREQKGMDITAKRMVPGGLKYTHNTSLHLRHLKARFGYLRGKMASALVWIPQAVPQCEQ